MSQHVSDPKHRCFLPKAFYKRKDEEQEVGLRLSESLYSHSDVTNSVQPLDG